MKLLLCLLTAFVIFYCFAAPIETQSDPENNAVNVPSPASPNDDDALLSRLAKLTDGPLTIEDVLWVKYKVMPRLEEHFETAYMEHVQTLQPAYRALMDALVKLFSNPQVQRLMETILKPIKNVDPSVYETAKELAEVRLQFIIHCDILEVRNYYFSMYRYVDFFNDEERRGFLPTPEIINYIREAKNAQLLLNLFASNTTPLEQINKEWEALLQTSYPPIEKLIPFMKNCAVLLKFQHLQTKSLSHEASSNGQSATNPTVYDPDYVEVDQILKHREVKDDVDSNEGNYDLKLKKLDDDLRTATDLFKKKSASWPLIKPETDDEIASENDYAPYKDTVPFLNSIQEALDCHLQLFKSFDFKKHFDRYIMASNAMASLNIYQVMKTSLDCMNPYILLETALQSYQSIFTIMDETLSILYERLEDRYGDSVDSDLMNQFVYCDQQLRFLCQEHKYIKLLCKIQKEFLKLERNPSVHKLKDFIQLTWKDVAMMELCMTLGERCDKQISMMNFQKYLHVLKNKRKVSLEEMKQFCRRHEKILNLFLKDDSDNLVRMLGEYIGVVDVMSTADNNCDDFLKPTVIELEKEFGLMRANPKPDLMSGPQNIDSSFEMSTMLTGSTSGDARSASESLGGGTSLSPNLE